ncbi:MAG: PAS domain S-box protein [Methanoregula sp.]|nr:PAS domain S-box protein [Methanoregula sp.]
MGNHIHVNQAHVPSPVTASAKDNGSGAESSPISVLYVDDERSLLEPTRLSLEKRGNISVDTSISVQDALEKMQVRSYDVIVSDYQMPEIDGLEFLKQLRKSGNTIPFIIFTGKGREDAVIESYNAGADFYLAKGGNPKAMFLDLTNKIVQIVTRRRAEKALRESEERYRKVMEQSHDAIFIVRGSKFVFVNDRVSEISGFTKKELYDMEIWELLHPDDRAPVLEISRSRADGGPAPHTYEARVVTKSGEVRHLEFAVTTVVSDGENALLCSVRDITDRKRSDEALRISEAKYRSIFTTFDDLYYQTDPKGIITILSPSCKRITGWDSSELIGHQVLDLYPFPDQRKLFLDKMFTEGMVNDFEVILKNKTGTHLNVSVTSHVVHDESGNPVAIEGTLRDITERKQVEEALAASEDKYRTLADFLPVMVFEADISGRVTFANRLAYPTFGINPADITSGTSFMDYIVPEERRIVLENMQKVLRDEERESSEYTLMRKDGSRFPAMIKASAVVDKKTGTVSGIRGVIIDLTERNLKDEALRQSEASYHGLFNAVKDAICILDETGSFIDANKGAEEMFGYPHAFFNGDIVDQLSAHARNDMNQVKNLVNKAFREGPQQSEFWARKNNGDEILTDIRAYKGTYFGKDVIILLAVDITDRKRAEDALQKAYAGLEQKVAERTHELSALTVSLQNEISERNRIMEALAASEEKYRSLMEQIVDIVFHVDQEGIITYVSPHAMSALGMSGEHFPKFSIFDLAPDSYKDTFRKIIDPVLVSHAPVSGFEIEIPASSSNKKLIYEVNARPTYDKNGSYTGYSGIARDITDRKNLQNEVNASLLEKEILLKEIHHRVKNNMQVISSLLSLQAKLMKDEKSRGAILESQTRVMSIALVHEKLYQSKSFAEIDYHDYLKKIVENLLQSYGIPPGKVRIEIHADKIVLPINKAIPISLIINELLSNSLKYAFPGERTGVIVVDVRKTGDRYFLVVKDNGIGIPEGIDLGHIETLGLQLVNSLVAQILGTITMSREGGTEFRVDFIIEPAGG